MFIGLLLVALGSFARATSVETANDSFAADVYPSERTAVQRLVEQIARQIPNREQVTVVEAEDQALVEPLRRAFANARVVKTSEVSSTDPPMLRFECVVSEKRDEKREEGRSIAKRDANEPVSPRSGRVTVLCKGKDVSLSADARFVGKPWADDWTLFRNTNPKKRFLLAESSNLETSESAALDSARRAAVEQLVPLVRETMSARAARSRGRTFKLDEAWIRNRVRSTLERNVNNVVIPDTFVQKLQRPYGDVWAASLLIDASQKNLESLADGYNDYARAQLITEATSWAAVGGIIVVIVLLYLFLNTVTKGYFLWRLRALGILAAIAGVLIVFATTQ